MEKVLEQQMKVSIFMDNGELVEYDKKMAGIALVKTIEDREELELVFSKQSRKARGCSKNPTIFEGEHTNARLQKNGGHRLTTMIPGNYNLKSEVARARLIEEFRKALESIA